ncbi:MAG: hypothetical protein ACKVHP_18055 [Verrucomicrobiales bacterium]
MVKMISTHPKPIVTEGLEMTESFRVSLWKGTEQQPINAPNAAVIA